MHLACETFAVPFLGNHSDQCKFVGLVERVQKRIAHWDKQDNNVPAPNCMLKVRGEIIKVEGL